MNNKLKEEKRKVWNNLPNTYRKRIIQLFDQGMFVDAINEFFGEVNIKIEKERLKIKNPTATSQPTPPSTSTPKSILKVGDFVRFENTEKGGDWSMEGAVGRVTRVRDLRDNRYLYKVRLHNYNMMMTVCSLYSDDINYNLIKISEEEYNKVPALRLNSGDIISVLPNSAGFTEGKGKVIETKYDTDGDLVFVSLVMKDTDKVIRLDQKSWLQWRYYIIKENPNCTIIPVKGDKLTLRIDGNIVTGTVTFKYIGGFLTRWIVVVKLDTEDKKSIHLCNVDWDKYIIDVNGKKMVKEVKEDPTPTPPTSSTLSESTIADLSREFAKEFLNVDPNCSITPDVADKISSSSLNCFMFYRYLLDHGYKIEKS